ncbi:MAG: DUF6382 domain-containing protein [Clostridiales bacterium]|jgi:hypothetical protein|nr:FHA domain-containing protein [Eubacteriales bacterium]MDH7566304.1 DUF6382 domain-containing protein [Clostridiales bacterium]
MSSYFSDLFRTSTEKDMGCTYSVLSLNPAGKFVVLGYQVEMMANNPVPDLLPLEVRRRDEDVKFYYDITSKIPLKDYLKNRKLNKQEFIDLVLGITALLSKYKNLLLSENNFILSEEHIYFDPSSRSLSLMYLPVKMDFNQYTAVKDLVIKLITKTAFIEIQEGDIFLQRIIEYLKTDGLTLADFNRFLARIRDEKPQTAGSEASLPLEKPLVFESSRDIQDTGDKKAHPLNRKSAAAALLLQFVLLCASVAGEKLMRASGMDELSRYAAIAAAVIICDLLMLKFMFLNKGEYNSEKRKKPEGTHENLSSHGESILIKGRKNLSAKKEDKPAGLSKAEGKDLPVPRSSKSEYAPKSYDETALLSRADAPLAELVHEEEGRTESHPITKDSFIIGRNPGISDMVIDEKAVGRIHAEIISKGCDYYIVDRNSKNGTYLNQERLAGGQEYKLENNDTVIFANKEYRFILKI